MRNDISQVHVKPPGSLRGRDRHGGHIGKRDCLGVAPLAMTGAESSVFKVLIRWAYKGIMPLAMTKVEVIHAVVGGPTGTS